MKLKKAEHGPREPSKRRCHVMQIFYPCETRIGHDGEELNVEPAEDEVDEQCGDDDEVPAED